MFQWKVFIGCFAFIFVPLTSRADTGTEVHKNISSSLFERLDLEGRAGLSLATFRHNDETVSYSSKLGISLGAGVGFRLTKVLAVQAEMVFTTKGPNGRSGIDAATYHLNYIEMPVLVRVTLPLRGTITYRAFLGPTLSILLAGDLVRDDGRTTNLNERLERFELGVMLGAGAAVPVGQGGAVTFDIRYNVGLTNIDKTAGPVDDDVMNRTVYFLVGYQTDLGFLSGAAPAASKSSMPIVEPPANDNEPAPPDAVPTAGEPEAETEEPTAEPEPNDVPSPE